MTIEQRVEALEKNFKKARFLNFILMGFFVGELALGMCFAGPHPTPTHDLSWLPDQPKDKWAGAPDKGPAYKSGGTKNKKPNTSKKTKYVPIQDTESLEDRVTALELDSGDEANIAVLRDRIEELESRIPPIEANNYGKEIEEMKTELQKCDWRLTRLESWVNLN
jgi:hypothetical protein